MEFNFVHGDPLSLADQVFVFKRTMREAALRHNMYATFMAKPLQNEPGVPCMCIRVLSMPIRV